MFHFFYKFFLLNIYIFSFVIHAQNLEGNQSNLLKKIEASHKKEISEAAFLINSNKQKEAYTILHKLLKKKLSPHSRTSTYLILGSYFNKKQLIDSSLFYSNEALKYSNKFIKNDSVKSKVYAVASNLLAINSKRRGLYEESKNWHIKGIAASQKYKEVDLYYTHIHGFANDYRQIGNYQEALKLYEECLNYKDDIEIIYGSYINIGLIYAHLKNYKTSNRYLKRALKLSIKNNYAVTVIKLNLAENYQEQKDIDNAILLYKECLELSKKYELNHLALESQIKIGSIYYDLKKYKDAEIIYSSSLYYAIDLGYLDQQKNIYEKLQEIALASNNYKKAFFFATKNFQIKDSINNLQKNKKIVELEVRYKTLEKVKEIKLLQIENSNRKLEIKNKNEAIKNLKLKQEVENKESENKTLSFLNASERKRNEIILLKKDKEIQEAKLIREKSIKNAILYFFLILLIPIIGLLVIYYQKLRTQSELNKKQEEINNQKITSLIKDQELIVIKASIKGQNKERKRIAEELHDSIGGNLAAIKLKINNSLTKNIEKTSLSTINSQIDYTYEQVRNLSHTLIPKQFNENNFCDILEEYTNSIWGANSSFVVYPRKEINLLNKNFQIEIFKIIQELITNTIKHAKATSIELQMNLIDNELNILFEDNGIGFLEKNHKDGIGFENIKNRLNKFGGTFNIDSRINRGTILNIEIPTLITIENEV